MTVPPSAPGLFSPSETSPCDGPAPEAGPPRAPERTPSPTPEEQRVLDDDGSFCLRENWGKLASIAAMLLFTVILAVFQKQLVYALEPLAGHVHGVVDGYLIPIALLMVLSIPPLCGQQILLMFIGLTWSLNGLAIAAAGTLFGEVITFFLYKALLRPRATRIEEDHLKCAIFARVIRDGDLTVAVIARYSVTPSHFTTALFAVCGVSFPTFLLAAVLSLPTQFVYVLLGYLAHLQADGHGSASLLVLDVAGIVLLVAVTVFAAWFMRARQNGVKDAVVYARRRQRRAMPCTLDSLGTLEKGKGVPILLVPQPRRVMSSNSIDSLKAASLTGYGRV